MKEDIKIIVECDDIELSDKDIDFLVKLFVPIVSGKKANMT